MSGFFKRAVRLLATLPIGHFKLVREHEKIVIYRLGQFHDVAGPGLVFLHRFADTIERHIDTHYKLRIVDPGPLYFFDVPFFYTINLRYKFGKFHRAQTREELKDMVERGEDDLHREIDQMVLIQLRKLIDQLQASGRVQPNASHGAKVGLIQPGAETAILMMAELKKRLSEQLPNIGVALDPAYEINIHSFRPDDAIIKILTRDRTHGSLQRMGELTEGTTRLLAGIEEIDLPRSQQYRLDSNVEGDVKAEFRQTEDGMEPRLRTSAGRKPHENPAAQPKSPRPTGKPVDPLPEDDVLTADDLRVLKVLPRRPRRDRAA